MVIRNLIPSSINIHNELQSSGLVPVLRVVTQSSYTDTELGTLLLIDTLPLSLRAEINYTNVRHDHIGLQVYSGSRISAVASTITGAVRSVITGVDSVDDRNLVGFEIDAGVGHGQPYPILSGIFNVRAVFGSGEYDHELIRHGYPIWVYMGYIDNMNNIISHPSDPTKYDNIPLVFGGLISGMTKDKTSAGSRITARACGYNWYLHKFVCRYNIDLYINSTIFEAFDSLFKVFHICGGSKISPLMRTLLRMNDSSSSLPEIVYAYGAHENMVPLFMSKQIISLMNEGWNFLEGIMNIEKIYNVDIEWDENGYLMVHGRDDPLSRIIKDGKESDKHTHNIVVGGNTLNIEYNTDSTDIVDSICIYVTDYNILSTRQFILDKDFIRSVLLHEYKEQFNLTHTDEMAIFNDYEENTFNIFPGKEISVDLSAFASQNVENEYDFLKSHGIVNVDIPTVPLRIVAEIIKRTHFWGMGGSAMVAGNPFIHVGDLVQVIDISTDRSSTFINFSAVKDMSQQLSDKLDRLRTMTILKRDYVNDRLNSSYGIPSLDNIYYVWKVKHYLGERGFMTKVHFVKQRHAPLRVDNIIPALPDVYEDVGKDDRLLTG